MKFALVLFSILSVISTAAFGAGPEVPAGKEQKKPQLSPTGKLYELHAGNPPIFDPKAWGPQVSCPEGSFAAGFELYMEPQIDGDDTALNAIRLSCRNSNGDLVTTIRSLEGGMGRRHTRVLSFLSGKKLSFLIPIDVRASLG